MDGSTVILNVAYTILLVSTFTRTILWLRAVLICSSTAFVVYGIASGITSVAIWNALAGVLHVYQLVTYLRARRAVTVTPEDAQVHAEHFSHLDRFDFATMWSVGDTRTFQNEQMTTRGQPQDWTALILDGRVEVRRNGSVLAVLGRGDLVGELSYVSGRPASADTHAVGPVRVRSWQQAQLRTLDALNPGAGRAFHRYLLNDLAHKVSPDDTGEGSS